MLVETFDFGRFRYGTQQLGVLRSSASLQMEKSIFLMILCKANFFAVLDRDVRLFDNIQVCSLVRYFVG